MIPDHCRHVSVRKVSYPLSQEQIVSHLNAEKIYKNTNYLILNNDQEWAVIKVGKTPARGLFWPITNVTILSLPKDTVYLTAPDIDVLNCNSMARAAHKLPGKTVVIEGKFGHVSFYKPEQVIELTVLDLVPPGPPKLVALMEDILKLVSFSKPIIINEKVIDIESILDENKDGHYIFPCRASGMGNGIDTGVDMSLGAEVTADKTMLYLDECPEIGSELKNKLTLVGCNLSVRIFSELYGYTPKVINICPENFISDIPKTKPVLIKCCAVKRFEREGNVYKVPWGVTYQDLEHALHEIVNDY